MKVKEDYLREIKERAEKALNKKAPLGPDVDLNEFYLCSSQEEVDSVESISASLREAALMREGVRRKQKLSNLSSGRPLGSLSENTGCLSG